MASSSIERRPASSAVHHRFGGELRALARFSMMLTAYELVAVAGGVATTWILARLGMDALAAGGMVGSVLLLVYLGIQGLLQGLAIVMSQAIGSGQREIARSIAIMGLTASVLLGLGLTALLALLPALLELLPGSAQVHGQATRFVYGLIPGMLPSCVLFALRVIIFAQQKSRSVVLLTWAGLLVNVTLAYGLSLGAFGIAPLGIMGIGLASSITASAQLIAQSLLFASNPQTRYYLTGLRNRSSWWDAAVLRRGVGLGLPVAAVMLIEGFLVTVSYFLMASFGVIQLAGHALTQQWMAIVLMAPVGISQAVMIRMAVMVGARNAAACRRVAAAAILITLAFTGIMATAFFFAGPTLASALLGTNETEVIAAAAVFLKIAALTQVFRGLVVVLAATLRGCGDTKVALWAVMAGYWGIGLGLALLTAFPGGLGGSGIWLGLSAGFLVACVSLAIKVRGTLATIDVTIARVEEHHAKYRSSHP